MKHFILALLRNRLSLLLVIAHSIFVVIIYTMVPTQNRVFYHAYEEPLLFKILTTIDYPAILVVGLIFWPFFSEAAASGGVLVNSYYLALVIATTIQWLLIGYLASRLYLRLST